MTTKNRTLTGLCAGALALTLAFVPLAGCSSRQSQSGGTAETTEDQPEIEDGTADIDEGATSPQDEAAQNLKARLLNHDTWVLTRRSSDVQSDYLTYHEETTYERDTNGAVTSLQTVLTDEEGAELSSSTSSYTLDSSGNAASAQYTAAGGRKNDVTFTYQYDDEGRIVERKASNGVIDRYAYGSAGTIVEVTSISAPSGDETDYEYHVVITYDELGFVQSMVSKEPEGESTTEYRYEYGEDGMPISCGVTINDEPSSIITFTYDQNDNIVHSEATSADGTVINNYTWEKVDEPTAFVQAESYLKSVE